MSLAPLEPPGAVSNRRRSSMSCGGTLCPAALCRRRKLRARTRGLQKARRSDLHSHYVSVWPGGVAALLPGLAGSRTAAVRTARRRRLWRGSAFKGPCARSFGALLPIPGGILVLFFMSNQSQSLPGQPTCHPLSASLGCCLSSSAVSHPGVFSEKFGVRFGLQKRSRRPDAGRARRLECSPPPAALGSSSRRDGVRGQFRASPARREEKRPLAPDRAPAMADEQAAGRAAGLTIDVPGDLAHGVGGPSTLENLLQTTPGGSIGPTTFSDLFRNANVHAPAAARAANVLRPQPLTPNGGTPGDSQGARGGRPSLGFLQLPGAFSHKALTDSPTGGLFMNAVSPLAFEMSRHGRR